MSNIVAPDPHTIRHADGRDFAVVRRHYAMVQDAHAAQFPEIFRPMVQEDFPVVRFQFYLGGDNLLLIAELGGEVAGSLLATLNHVADEFGYRPCRTALIWYVVTEPALRRRGIARSLIGAAAEWAEQKDASRLELSVWSFNVEARELYRKLGFTESNVSMTVKPSDALARWGSGRLPRMRLPKWMTPWRFSRAAPPQA